MVDFPEVEIQTTLFDHLRSFAWEEAQIAWPNKGFKPTPGTAWLRPSILPAETIQETLGDSGVNRHSGLLQIDVFWPAGEGIERPVEVAGALIKHFKRGTVLAGSTFYVRVPTPPSRATHRDETNWCQVPVLIPWLAFTPPN